MEKIKAIMEWIQIQGPVVVALVLAILSVAEIAVRLTPTEKDDAAVERLGKMIKRFLDMLGVPNYKSGGGEHAPKIEPK